MEQGAAGSSNVGHLVLNAGQLQPQQILLAASTGAQEPTVLLGAVPRCSLLLGSCY